MPIVIDQPTNLDIRDNVIENPSEPPETTVTSLTARIEKLQTVAELEEGEPLLPVTAYKAFMVPEGVPTVDGRMMLLNSLDWRETVPLMVIDKNLPAHLQAVFVGRVENMQREEIEGETWITGFVVWDTDADALEAQRMVDEEMLQSVSVDVAAHEVRFREPEPEEEEGPIDADVKVEKAEEKEPPLPEGVDMAIVKGTIVGLTQVPMPAFDRARIEAVAAGAMRHSDPVLFTRPGLSGPTQIQYDEGHVFGHGAAWEVCHVGLHACVKPPKSNLGYALAAREKGPVGPVVPIYFNEYGDSRAHAPLDLTFWQAIDWYQRNSRMVGLVATGEDQFGIWVAGVCTREIAGRHLSGDWRPYPTGHEHIGWSIVDNPGYPIPDPALVAAGPTAIIGAGIPCGCDGEVIEAVVAAEVPATQVELDLLNEVHRLRELASSELLTELRMLNSLFAEALLQYKTHTLQMRTNGLRK